MGKISAKAAFLKTFSFPSPVPVSLCQAIWFLLFSVCQSNNMFWSIFHIQRNENKGNRDPQPSEISSSVAKPRQCLCIWNKSFITVNIIIHLNGWMMPYNNQQPGGVPLVTSECFRCLGASHGKLTSKECSPLPHQDRRGSSPTSLDLDAFQWPFPLWSLVQLQHQQVKLIVCLWVKLIVCLWIMNMFLSKLSGTGSKEVLTSH